MEMADCFFNNLLYDVKVEYHEQYHTQKRP